MLDRACPSEMDNRLRSAYIGDLPSSEHRKEEAFAPLLRYPLG
jgi:hypothetical protein